MIEERAKRTEKTVSQGRHKPAFHWEAGTIFDGERPVSRFEAERKWGDLSFKDVILQPGGKPLARWVASWFSQATRHYTHVLDDSHVDASNPERMKMKFVSSTPDGDFTSHLAVELSYDANLDSYVYDVATMLKMNRFPFRNWKEFCASTAEYYMTLPLEYVNFWPYDHDEWRYWLYRDVEEQWTRLPFTYAYPSGLYDIQFSRKDARMVMTGEHPRCLVVELFDRTPHHTEAALCWACHDMHVRAHRVMASRTYWAKYRVFSMDRAWGEARLAESRFTEYTPEEIAEYERPRFDEGQTCEFVERIALDRPDSGKIWIPFGDVGVSSWCRSGGYENKGCILTSSSQPVDASWQLHGTQAPQAEAGKAYRLTALIRTRQLAGSGARIGMQEGGDAPIQYSRALSGDNDWTPVELAAPARDRNRRVHVILQHEGAGESRFSRVAFEPVM